MKTMKKIQLDEGFFRMLVLLIVLSVFSIVTRGASFLSMANLQNIMIQMVEYGLMALGLSIAMISGGIDLSAAYVANLCGISAGLIMQQLSPNGELGGMLVASIVALLIGILCGSVNGILISVVHIPAMLATLGTYELFYGLSIVISGSGSISSVPGFNNLAGSRLFGVIPSSFVIFVIVAVVLSFIIGHTTFGKKVHMLGISPSVSKFSGNNNVMTTVAIYITSGLCASIAGLISLSRVSSARADFGSNYTMMTILIAVLGGCDPNGGKGQISGVAVAVVVVQLISAYLNTITGISAYWRQALYGVLLLAIMVFNHTANKHKRSRK